MKTVIVTGSFDDLRSYHVRFLEEAANFGAVHVLLWSDDTIQTLTGSDPTFPQEERLYLLRAIRYTHEVSLLSGTIDPDAIPEATEIQPDVWVVDAASDTVRKGTFCANHGVEYRVLSPENLRGFPPLQTESMAQIGDSSRKKVLVTGCFDWLHSGHVRFFEEVSQLGDLFVCVGNDANVKLLRGAGHPMLKQDERRYMVQSIRYVTRALITSGSGWMDAAPEIADVKPDIYAVNEDGDQPEKRAFCAEYGLEYIVLKRLPKEGLPRRESTKLRGF